MKKTILLTLVLVSTALFAAGYKLYTGKVIFWDSTSPNPVDEATALVQMDSVSKGFLPPRMTTAQRDALTPIPPATGLTVYDTDRNKVYVWNGSKWAVSGSGVGGGFEYLALAEIAADDVSDVSGFLTGNVATFPDLTGAAVALGNLTREVTPTTDFYDPVENTAVYKYAVDAGEDETNDYVLTPATEYPVGYATPEHFARTRFWYWTMLLQTASSFTYTVMELHQP